jgi:phenylpyruvate tautomerase PptA (4-oxalocrotonate tautomerase family)
MPLYDIEHVIPLTATQQLFIANALTQAHASRFHTPSYFINVRFTDVSAMKVYRSGRLVKYNRAILRTRQSEGRTPDVLNEHCRAVIECWERVVGKGDEKGLHAVWILGALSAGMEAGFARPKVRVFYMEFIIQDC